MLKNLNQNMPDIYFEEEYGKLSLLLETEGSVIIPYNYKDENGQIYNLVIKRPIDIKIDDKQYYDLITPYGYGGPIIMHINDEIENSKEKLLDNFEKDFLKFCNTNNIVSEFVRFHPILENALDFKKMYNPIFLQHTVATICDEGNPCEFEFSKSARKTIRRSMNENISYDLILNPKNLDEFKDIYYNTMDRNEALDFYYFGNEYFDYILANFKENIININVRIDENKIIASGLYFIYNNRFIHAHLSGTRKEYLKYSPAYVLKQVLAEWAYNNGYTYIHYGGGTSTDENDSLYLFKKRFTRREPFDFYVGRKIYNDEIYDKLVEKTKTSESNFFPQYRDLKIFQNEKF